MAKIITAIKAITNPATTNTNHLSNFLIGLSDFTMSVQKLQQCVEKSGARHGYQNLSKGMRHFPASGHPSKWKRSAGVFFSPGNPNRIIAD
jgi:hypothetical protein